MPKWEIGYKVFGPGDVSVFRKNEKEGKTLYHQWVNYSRCGFGPFAVFKSLEAAEYFSKRCYRLAERIARVWYLPSPRTHVWCPNWYANIRNLEKHNRDLLLPGETVLADALMIAE
jgi:hypothetical protein